MASGDDTAQGGDTFHFAVFPFLVEFDSSVSCPQIGFNTEIMGGILKSCCRDLTPKDSDLISQEWGLGLGVITSPQMTLKQR